MRRLRRLLSAPFENDAECPVATVIALVTVVAAAVFLFYALTGRDVCLWCAGT